MAIATYVRVSPREQAGETGLETRKQKKIREWARLHDIGIIRLYEDLSVSSRALDREGLQQLLSDVEEDGIPVVIHTRPNRLSRSLKIFLTLL